MAITAKGKYFGKTEDWLLAQLDSAQNAAAAGSATTQINSGDSGAQKQVFNSPGARISDIKQALYSLYLQDSVTYAKYADFASEGQSFATAVFS